MVYLLPHCTVAVTVVTISWSYSRRNRINCSLLVYFCPYAGKKSPLTGQSCQRGFKQQYYANVNRLLYRSANLTNRELIAGRGLECLSGPENRFQEPVLVDRIREILCFQAESASFSIDRASLSLFSIRNEIAGVELESRKICESFHADAGLRLIGFRKLHTGCTFPLQDKIMVVPADILQLSAVSRDVTPDCLRLCEIKGCPGYRCNLPCRNCLVVSDRCIGSRFKLKNRILNASGIMTAQIEVSVIGQIADRIPVTFCLILKQKSVILCQCLGNGSLEVSRIPLSEIRILDRECNRAVRLSC